MSTVSRSVGAVLAAAADGALYLATVPQMGVLLLAVAALTRLMPGRQRPA